MKALLTKTISLLVLAAVGLAMFSALITSADPAVRAERVRREEIKTKAAAERAEAVTMLVQGLALVAIVGASGITVAVIGIAGSAAMHGLFNARTLRPDRRTGLFPIMVEQGGQQSFLLNPNTARSQEFAALSGGSGRGGRRPTAAAMRQLTAGSSGPEAPMIEAASREFPAMVDVFSAPLPKEPAFIVGVSGDGKYVSLPLRDLGNVVVAGLPKYGKTGVLLTMAASMWRADPEGIEHKAAFIDPKMVSMGRLPNLKCLAWPVALEMDEARAIVFAAQAECMRRFQVMRDCGATTLEEYRRITGDYLPYLTVFMDEIADMTLDPDVARRKQFIWAASDIGRKGRAAGVSLVMATQRPSVDVLPSSLRNLAGVAIAFRVQRNHDSIAILGHPGAEELPDIKGRCLMRDGETYEIQTAYAGLDNGRFYDFVGTLPLADRLLPPENTGTEPVQASKVVEVAVNDEIPVFSTDEPYAVYTVAHIREIVRRFEATKSTRYPNGRIKQVQRELYPGQSEGGHWFYRIRDVLRDVGALPHDGTETDDGA